LGRAGDAATKLEHGKEDPTARQGAKEPHNWGAENLGNELDQFLGLLHFLGFGRFRGFFLERFSFLRWFRLFRRLFGFCRCCFFCLCRLFGF